MKRELRAPTRSRRSLVERVSVVAIIACVGCALSSPANAYVGPGGGLSALGSVLALGVAIVAALFGFVWYPLKRLFRRIRGAGSPPKDSQP